MRLMLRHAVALAALWTVFATACGPFHPGSHPEAVIVFRNQSPDQADVYAIGSSGEPTRIGTVFPQRTETLRIPVSVTGGADRVNIVVRMFPGSRIVASGPFTLGPGESMDVTLGADERTLSVLPSRG